MSGTTSSKKIFVLLVLSTIFLALPTFVLADSGLQANYHFSEGAGTSTADSSGNVNTGTLVNSPAWVSGVIGNALSYNSASSQFTKISNSPFLDGITNSTVSVAAWVKTSSATDQVIFSSWDGATGYQLWLNNGKPAIWSNGGSSLVSSASIADGNWHYVVGVWDGTNGYVYVDGALKVSAARTFSASTKDNQIGAQCSGAGSTSCNVFFNGIIDEVRVYNRNLSAGEILNAFTYNVCSSGCEFDKIQDAVGNATAGNTINVAPGTYNENQIVINTPVNVIGAGPGLSIIDGGDATLATNGLIRIVSTGNVTFSGFTVKNAGGPTNGGDGNDGLTNVGIFAQSASSGNNYTISNNVILGTNVAADQEDYGLYADGGLESLIFTNNTISQMAANPILVEVNPGPIQIGNNILGVGLDLSDSIFVMSHSGVNVSSLQNVSYNTIDLSGSGKAAGITIISSYPASAYGDGTFSNVKIIGNTLVNVGNSRRGIGLYDYATNGALGQISSAIISGNTIVGTGSTPDFGIRLAGLVTNTTVMNNNVTNVGKAFYGTVSLGGDHYPSGIIVRNNSFANSVFGIYLDYFANSTITGNTVFGNQYEGIQLNGTTDPIININISSNIVHDNSRHGILLVGNSNNNTVTGNTVFNNTYAQIAMWSPSSPFPTFNLAYLNYIFKGSGGSSYTAGDWGVSNSWNATNASNSGNFWSDLSSNPGFSMNPIQYNLPQGTAGAIDYHPIIPSVVYVDPAYNSTNAGGHIFGFDAFTTIQGGINAVTPGGTVFVDSATYFEQLFISKNVSLRNTTVLSPIIQSPLSLIPDSNGAKSIVTINGTNVNVSLSGFVVSGPGPSSCGSITAGIFVRDGAFANINGNTIANISDNPLSGCQNGVGIFVGRNAYSTIGTATISNNNIYGYQKGGIVVDNAGSNATITGNTISGIGITPLIAQNGIQVSRGAFAIIQNNNIQGNWYNYSASACTKTNSETIWNTCDMSTGILIFETNGVMNNGNVLQGNQIGVAVTQLSSAISLNNTISKDKVSNSQYGVGIDGNYTIVIANSIFNNTHGIWITGNSSNITQNNVTNNVGATGIHLTGTSKNNIIYNNIFSNNIPQAVDYGSGNKWNTSTTGNVWSDFYSNPGSPTQYRINMTITPNAIDYHPIIPLTISQVTVRYNYLREDQAQYVDIYVSDPYGVSQGNVIVQDNSTPTHFANYTANVLTSNKLFRAVFSAQGLKNHTLRIFVTDNVGFVDFTKTAKFYVEPSTPPQVTNLNVNLPSPVHNGNIVQITLTFDRLMDKTTNPTVTLRGSTGGTVALGGTWLPSSTQWRTNSYTIPSTMRTGSYTLIAVNAKDLTGHKMDTFSGFAFTKS